MRTFRCKCGNRLFFESSQCVACARVVRFCPTCRQVTAMEESDEPGVLRCGDPACQARLARCANDLEHGVCNRAIALMPSVQPNPSWRCDCCLFNHTIPDLSIAGNREKWYRLEAAKRRMFYDLETLGLPIGAPVGLPLSFDFKEDLPRDDTAWWRMDEGERVYTGHAGGKITINLREAEPVERERLRESLGEAHRTLIGHFRHEFGHYYWETLVRGRPDVEAACARHFGDPYNPPYDQALAVYYERGAPANWHQHYVSRYATMHPWEDFAETFAMYLDMIASLDTAWHLEFVENPPADFDAMIATFRELSLAMNEMNRTMGLVDLAPGLLTPPVVEKMRYIHGLLTAAAQGQSLPWSDTRRAG